jgi:hypothetical protein
VIVELASRAFEIKKKPLTEVALLPSQTMDDSPSSLPISALSAAALRLPPTFASDVVPLPVGSVPLSPGAPPAAEVPASAKTSAPEARSAPMALMIFMFDGSSRYAPDLTADRLRFVRLASARRRVRRVG